MSNRRYIANIRIPTEVKLSTLLRNKPFNYNNDSNNGLIIIDDCHDINIDNLDILNYYHFNYKILAIKDLSIKNHELFLRSWNSNDKIQVSFLGVRIPRIMEIYNPDKEILVANITDQNICSIYPKDRWKIDKTIINNPSLHEYESSLLDSETFLRHIDVIAYLINKHSNNDVDKIVLVNKFIKDNIIYDNNCYYETLIQRSNPSYNIEDSIYGLHVGHYAQSVITRKKSVCSAIASFCTMLLNHPLINIESKYIVNHAVIDDHAWNNVKINDKWYSCDFTWTIYKNPKDISKYILIKPRSTNDPFNEKDIYSMFDYSRDEIYKSMDKLKDINIIISDLKQKNIRRKVKIIK